MAVCLYVLKSFIKREKVIHLLHHVIFLIVIVVSLVPPCTKIQHHVKHVQHFFSLQQSSSRLYFILEFCIKYSSSQVTELHPPPHSSPPYTTTKMYDFDSFSLAQFSVLITPRLSRRYMYFSRSDCLHHWRYTHITSSSCHNNSCRRIVVVSYAIQDEKGNLLLPSASQLTYSECM